MPLSITASNVLATNASTTIAYGTADRAITAGKVVYLDRGVTPNLIRPAQGNSQAQAQSVVGIALDSSAGSAQPIAYATSGDVTLGGVLNAGSVYVLGT